MKLFLLVGVLGVGLLDSAGAEVELPAQPAQTPLTAWTLEFSASAEDGADPTFRSEPQPIEVRDVMGSVLATVESYRLLTDLSESRLAACKSTRPDLPDARIDPAEIADRVGSFNLAMFGEDEVNFTFRTTTDGPEYALTVNASDDHGVQVSSEESGRLVLSATGARLSVTREKAQTFSCAGAADFTIILSP